MIPMLYRKVYGEQKIQESVSLISGKSQKRFKLCLSHQQIANEPTVEHRFDEIAFYHKISVSDTDGQYR